MSSVKFIIKDINELVMVVDCGVLKEPSANGPHFSHPFTSNSHIKEARFRRNDGVLSDGPEKNEVYIKDLI